MGFQICTVGGLVVFKLPAKSPTGSIIRPMHLSDNSTRRQTHLHPKEPNIRPSLKHSRQDGSIPKLASVYPQESEKRKKKNLTQSQLLKPHLRLCEHADVCMQRLTGCFPEGSDEAPPFPAPQHWEGVGEVNQVSSVAPTHQSKPSSRQRPPQINLPVTLHLDCINVELGPITAIGRT